MPQRENNRGLGSRRDDTDVAADHGFDMRDELRRLFAAGLSPGGALTSDIIDHLLMLEAEARGSDEGARRALGELEAFTAPRDACAKLGLLNKRRYWKRPDVATSILNSIIAHLSEREDQRSTIESCTLCGRSIQPGVASCTLAPCESEPGPRVAHASCAHGSRAKRMGEALLMEWEPDNPTLSELLPSPRGENESSLVVEALQQLLEAERFDGKRQPRVSPNDVAVDFARVALEALGMGSDERKSFLRFSSKKKREPRT